jgi:hypothetical protein
MTPLEEQLKQAMARREPPADFTQRLLEQVQREERQTAESGSWAWFRRLPTFWSAPRAWRLAGVVAALLVISGSAMYEHDRAVRGEAAKEKLLTAVRIAGMKLHQVHRQVLEVEAMEANQ